MCGAYTLDKEPDELMKRFGAAAPSAGYPRRFNIRPTQDVPVILNTRPGRIEIVSWGITPAWDQTGKKRIINARGDSLDKPTFRKSFHERRCLVLADGFYEWAQLPGQSRKRPFRFVLRSGAPFAFAGIWREQEDDGGKEPHCAIITTEPNALVGKVHDRMPAILRPEAEAEWLSLDTTPEQARELIRPYADEEMRAYEVSTLVNSPAHDTPEVLKPVTS